MPQRKPFRTIEDQLKILGNRKLELPDPIKTAEAFLFQNNYYRFSGYFRYFQISPAGGNENFPEGTHWSDIVDLYQHDLQLRNFLMDGLQKIELAARTAFSYNEAKLHDPYGKYIAVGAYKAPPSRNQTPTEDIILSEMRRSEEPFIKCHRKDNWPHEDSWMNEIPVWAAVETFSFGTLSKAISYREDGNQVYFACCDMLHTSREHLSVQLRAFAYLRNRCAHHSRLWNHFTKDQPSVQPKVKTRAKRDLPKHCRDYHGNSVLAVIVAMDDFLRRNHLSDSFLTDFLTLSEPSPEFQRGIAYPYNA